MADEHLIRVVTVCSNCSAIMPDDATYGDTCRVCGAGEYKQHEDALLLEIKRLSDVHEARINPSGGTDHVVVVAEEAGQVSDRAVAPKGKR